jgi:hypothetical protein
MPLDCGTCAPYFCCILEFCLIIIRIYIHIYILGRAGWARQDARVLRGEAGREDGGADSFAARYIRASQATGSDSFHAGLHFLRLIGNTTSSIKDFF